MALPIIAALAAPIVGGAMTLAGGAMSLTGGVLTAGSTIAGIAADAAGGVMGAVGGLLGGGKSGNVETTAQEQEGPKTPMGTYRDKKGVLRNDGTIKQRGSFASDPSKGMSLANIKSSIDPINAEGGVSMLPTGKESQVTLLSQILGQIRTNTGALFSIDAKIGGLIDAFSTPPPPPPPEPQDVINQAKQKKGDGVMSKLGDKVTGTFSALGKRLKSLSGSLAGAAKFALKGLLLTGALVLFRKYRENIVGFIARTFEKLSDFVKTFDTEDPIGSFFDKLMSTGEGSILNSLKNGVAFVIEELIYAIKLMANELLPDFAKFDLPYRGISSAPVKEVESIAANTGADMSKITIASAAAEESDFSGSLSDKKSLNSAIKRRINEMYQAFELSGGRVQFTGIGKDGFQMGLDPFASVRNASTRDPNVTVASIMNSVPIFDGKKITMEQLNAGLDYTAGFEGLDDDVSKKIIANLKEKSDLVQMREAGTTSTGFLFRKQPIDVTRIKGIETTNRELGFDVNKSDAANSVNVVNANDQKQIITKTGDNIQQGVSVHPRESTAIAEFKAAYQ